MQLWHVTVGTVTPLAMSSMWEGYMILYSFDLRFITQSHWPTNSLPIASDKKLGLGLKIREFWKIDEPKLETVQ
jgi:hypothetical protein